MTTTTTIPTSMCISPELDWNGRAGVQTIYCAATLTVLGRSEGPVQLDPDGKIRLRAFGVDLVTVPPKGESKWWVLSAVE